MKRATGVLILFTILLGSIGFGYLRFVHRQQITDFDMIRKKGKFHLAWSAAARNDIRHFIVERSEDGENFFPVDTVNAVFTTSETYKYLVTDSKAVPGKCYRLTYLNNERKKVTCATITVRHKQTSIALAPESSFESKALASAHR